MSASHRILASAATTVALVAAGMMLVAPQSGAVSDPSAGYVDDVPSTSPADLGDLDLTELQYGDPTEALDLIQPPKADVDGAASLAYPLTIPPGRAGVQPDLALTYDSSGGSGWVGTGWDLSVGAVTVDTEFGAPRYLEEKESETYSLDGARLFPNAIRTTLDARKPGPRSDWVRQIETEYELITRHGNSPSTYCWQVSDKAGNQRWYGGLPNAAGGCDRVADAVLTAPATGLPGGAAGDYHWALTYIEDISGNTVRFTYDKLTGVPIGMGAEAALGVSLYLKEIRYTGFTSDDAPDEPAYRVRFLRDGAVTGATPRRDVSVNAATGEPVVIRDLLGRVEVEYLSPEFYTSGAAAQLVKGWKLEYANGPYDKSLLTKVGQYGSGGPTTVHAWHTFEWFDEVSTVADNGTRTYSGFAAAEQWGTKDTTNRVNIAAQSALSTSWRAGADGGSYVGFNPAAPSKIGSFGGSFNIAGGQSNDVSTLVDLNGDGLPDKVFLSGGKVYYRPNLNRPGGTRHTDNSWFGPAQTITGIDSLGKSSDIRIDVHAEAYPAVAIQVGGGFGFGWGDRYFEDVNGDGRVDFIQPGSGGGHTVYYNVLTRDANLATDGVPTFIDSSLATQLADRLEVPLDAFTSNLAYAGFAEVEKLIVNTSPRIDTVRRWLAPHTGTIRIEGAVALPASYNGDGAQVSIEHDGAQKWKATLSKAAPNANHDVELAVTAGQPVWFRLHVINNAAGDAVTWDPTVTYLTGPGGDSLTAAPDANGRSQTAFDASDDFTLFGRTGARTALTEPGPITVSVAVDVVDPAGLSDDLHVTVVHGHGTAPQTTHEVLTVPQRTTGTASGSVDLTVAEPTVNPGPDDTTETQDDFDEYDYLEVNVVSDSPVDPTAYGIKITTTAAGPELPADADMPTDAELDIPLDLPIVPNVRVYSRTDLTAPYVPARFPDTDPDTFVEMNPAAIRVQLSGDGLRDDFTEESYPAVLTLKTLAGGLVMLDDGVTPARVEFPVAGLGMVYGTASIDFTPAKDTDYYIDVSVADPAVGARLALTSSIRWEWVEEDDDDADKDDEIRNRTDTDAGQLHWPDQDGIFPSGNRGWAYAGYNADHADANGADPLVESQFKFKLRGEEPEGGFNKDTPVPTADEMPSAGDVKGDVGSSFDPAFAFIPWGGTGSAVADRWRAADKETLNGTGTTMQADRLGADTAIPGLTTLGRPAPQTLSVSGDFNFMLGLFASFTAAAGGGRELRGYEDYNGDGYPDIRRATEIEYTGPRGALAGKTSAGDNPYDTSLAVSGGIKGSAIAISSTGAASKNGDGGPAGSNVEPTSTKSSRGMKIGMGLDVEGQWTNPLGDGSAELSGGGKNATEILQAQNSDRGGAAMDQSFIDINGDGLPDRVATNTAGELWVNLNLGYRFAEKAIQWSTGRTAANKDVGGTLSAGFELNAYEFSGGLAYSEGVGYSLFDWADIDGDGVPDRMNAVGGDDPTTVFGSGDGMSSGEITYGTYPEGNVAVDAANPLGGVPLPGGQLEVSRSTGLSGGADFTFYIGPICLVACYIVINPGAHAGYDRTTSQIQLTDMNGDGYLDAVKSIDYEHVEVRLNKHGRTNMLRKVTNPLGGQIRLDYERTGNTVENPESMWVMSSVEVDDGREGDGPSVQRSVFTYQQNRWDPLLRESLGFARIREYQVEMVPGDDRGQDKVLRYYERNYLNGSPFETGTLTEERTYDGADTLVERYDRTGTAVREENRKGALLRLAAFSWDFANADPTADGFGASVNVADLPAVGSAARTLLFDTALSPRLVTDSVTEYDAEGDTQSATTHYEYNAIGDVTSVWAENEHEVDTDDTFTAVTYSDCAPRAGTRAAVDSWVSVPQTVTVHAGKGSSGERLRYRNGGPALCDNSVPVRIAELVEEADENECGTDLFAITELSFDTWGSYNAVARPANEAPASCDAYPTESVAAVTFEGCSSLSEDEDAVRACVDYTYDEHRHTDIAEATDNHGVTASATYDPFTGRLASRTDENGNDTTYTYDPQGRLASITAPKEQGSGTPTVSYAYGGLAAVLNHSGAHTWSAVRHHDRFNAGNTLDTVSFVDGMGRVVQRKRDAEVDGVAGESRIVEGAVEFDALGRQVKEWYPVVETNDDFAVTTYNTWTSETGPDTTHVPVTAPISRRFNLLDVLLRQELPDGSTQTVTHDFAVLPGSDPGITMRRVVTTDPLGKKTTQWLDVRGSVFLRTDSPVVDNTAQETVAAVLPTLLSALPAADEVIADKSRIQASIGTPGDITTAYEYDRLGRLTAVVDTAGARTTHTYDRLDDVTSTTTPDAGLVARTFAPSGQLLTVTRAVGTVASYAYDRDRLTDVDYSDTTPDVRYEYGAGKAAENGAGRITRIVDGSMERTYGYDQDGNVARETATRAASPFSTGSGADPATWETAWEYDSLGRIALLTYPDGEALAHEYDLGGRPARLVSQAPQHDLYDQYGTAVARPDVEIVYVDEVRYDQFGEATYLRTGTGVETDYTYEPTRRFVAGIATDSTAVAQYDGTTSTARPLQRLQYTYDAVGNVLDTVNRLYESAGDDVVTKLGPPPVNNVPGPSQQSYLYDGHYRLTGGVATYVDRLENRGFTYQADYAPNGNLLAKRQATTTTSTTSKGGKAISNPRSKKGGGTGTDTTTERTCESNTGSGGGSFNQDPETTYVIAAGDLVYADDGGTALHRLIRSGSRNYSYDANGNMTGWTQPCAGGAATISRTLTWDAENRVTRLAEGNNDTEIRYNAEGERTLERGAGGTTWFVNEHWRTVNDGHRYANIYLGEQMVASHRTSSPAPAPARCVDTPEVPCPCRDGGACVAPVSQCNLATHVYDEATGTCQPKETRTVHFLHKDLQGSLRVATDETGKVFQYVDYLPTGRPWVAGQSTIKDTPYLFAGGWTDVTYDLVNFGERWHDSREQNFLSPEPLLEEEPYAVVDDPSLLAAYTYAASNPLRFVDTDGRAPEVASTGYILGRNNKKHQEGDITISVAARAARPAPAITFGGRYGNNAKGQALQKSFQKMYDNAERFTTILSFSTKEGVSKIRVFGVTVRKSGDKVAPDPGPGDSGADDVDIVDLGRDGLPQAPGTSPTAAGSQPGAPPPGGDDGSAGAGPLAPPPSAGDGASGSSPGTSGAGSAPAPPPPAAAAPAAPGPDNGN